jgi:uncharacterized protein
MGDSLRHGWLQGVDIAGTKGDMAMAHLRTIDGLEAHDRGDYAEALSKLEAGARAGDNQAFYNLGVIYAEGLGVPIDIKKAAVYFLGGAQRGSPLAAFNIANYYRKGTGVGKNYKKAAHWYHEAAMRGNYMAGHALAILYIKGQGVPRDLVEALAWIIPAAHASIMDINALDDGVRCASMMTKIEIAESDRRGRHYFETYMARNRNVVDTILEGQEDSGSG